MKKEIKGIANIEYSIKTLDLKDKKCQSLLEELYSFFSKSIKYGIFSSSDNTAFHQEFDYYLNAKKKDFIAFSKSVLPDLKTRMDSIPQSKGGYIIFAEIKNQNENFFVIFVVRDKTGKQFSYENNTMQINEVIHIDTNKLAMACRINVRSYQDKKDRYLSFLSTTQDETSKYFQKWIGAEAQSKSHEDTKSLRKIINDIDIPEDEDGNTMSREHFREKIYDLCSKAYSKDINLRAVSEEVWKDPDYISNYASQNSITINDEFMADETELRKMKKYAIFSDKIKLDFPSDYMGTKVLFDSTSDDTVIIKSKAFADKLRAEQ
ncbi:MAG: nucleoid-associated protein [Treponema sp.]|nr:nucleoid-associated protein [Treponema sp.]